MEKIEPPEPYKMSLVEFKLPLREQGQDPPTQYLYVSALKTFKNALGLHRYIFPYLKNWTGDKTESWKTSCDAAHLHCILYLSLQWDSEIQRFIVGPRIDMFQGCEHITALTGGIKYEITRLHKITIPWWNTIIQRLYLCFRAFYVRWTEELGIYKPT